MYVCVLSMLFGPARELFLFIKSTEKITFGGSEYSSAPANYPSNMLILTKGTILLIPLSWP